MFGYETIPQGERIAVWNNRGEVHFLDGPQRVFLTGVRIQRLQRFAAGNDEYLAITFKNGRQENIPGPADVWFHPVEDESIKICKVITIDANEAVVVFQQNGDGVGRRVVKGPAMYVPQANEWLQEFCWHGADPKNPTRKVYGALRFAKLRIIPDQMYFDVQDVRTADDALVVVKLMVFFELVDIDRMLDQTHDPIADFINAVTADVIDFAATLPFDKFKEQTDQLNDLATYPQLVQRGERIGYKINKVVYRGYHASTALQQMHDQAIEIRTRLRLEAETEEQAQGLADMKLDRELARAKQRQEMEEAEKRHGIQMEAIQHEAMLRQREAEQQREANGRKMVYQVEEEHQKAMNAEQAAFLKEMQGMNIDLTRYLVAQYQNPDRVIRIEDGHNAQLHLHE